MKSYELVADTIRGNCSGRTPIYGWLAANLKERLTQEFGSLENFEDKYEFDMAHLFGGPSIFDIEKIDNLRTQGVEITPEVMLDIPLLPADNLKDYQQIVEQLKHHREQRGRFCYVQIPGIFEILNSPFSIENHLMYLALYPDELKEVYDRQAKWNIRFAENMLDLGVDMIHVSDDWGAQNNMMFSPDMWKELIYPYHKMMSAAVKKRGAFLSLHSDGDINLVLDGIVDIGYDVIHPWQESAGMSYDVYLKKYSNNFGILGGLCVQTTLGFGDYQKVENEIRRVFDLLKGKRWIFCTSHFVQEHCSVDELVFAYDFAAKLARGY